MAMRLFAVAVAVAVAAFRVLGLVVRGLVSGLSVVLVFALVPEWRRRFADAFADTFWFLVEKFLFSVAVPAGIVIGGFKGLAAAEVKPDLSQAAREGRAVLASGGASVLFEFEPGPPEPQQNRARARLRTALATGGAGLLFEWESKQPSPEETGS